MTAKIRSLASSAAFLSPFFTAFSKALTEASAEFKKKGWIKESVKLSMLIKHLARQLRQWHSAGMYSYQELLQNSLECNKLTRHQARIMLAGSLWVHDARLMKLYTNERALGFCRIPPLTDSFMLKNLNSMLCVVKTENKQANNTLDFIGGSPNLFFLIRKKIGIPYFERFQYNLRWH